MNDNTDSELEQHLINAAMMAIREQADPEVVKATLRRADELEAQAALEAHPSFQQMTNSDKYYYLRGFAAGRKRI